MSNIHIATTEIATKEIQVVEKLMSLEEIDEIFPPGDGSLVSGLIAKIRELDRDNATMHSLLSDIAVFAPQFGEKIRAVIGVK